MKKIKVLIIDDSALVREVLTRILSADPQIEVLGSAMDPFFAVKQIKEQKPDVITLDVEMPRMDGLSFLKKLMTSQPIPVVMISSWTKKGADATIKALEMGAVDFVEKPQVGISRGMEEMGEEIAEKVKAAFQVDIVKLRSMSRGIKSTEEASKPAGEKSGVTTDTTKLLEKTTDRIIALGASTGGTTAVRHILSQFPPDMEPVVVVLHMPAEFTKSYAEGLDTASRMRVKEAVDGERVVKGHAYVAPGGKHLLIKRSGAQYLLKLTEDPPYKRHRPSVDKTFFSLAEAAGENAAAMVLTGMGDDGSEGLKAVREQGGWTGV